MKQYYAIINKNRKILGSELTDAQQLAERDIKKRDKRLMPLIELYIPVNQIPLYILPQSSVPGEDLGDVTWPNVAGNTIELTLAFTSSTGGWEQLYTAPLPGSDSEFTTPQHVVNFLNIYYRTLGLFQLKPDNTIVLTEQLNLAATVTSITAKITWS